MRASSLKVPAFVAPSVDPSTSSSLTAPAFVTRQTSGTPRSVTTAHRDISPSVTTRFASSQARVLSPSEALEVRVDTTQQRALSPKEQRRVETIQQYPYSPSTTTFETVQQRSLSPPARFVAPSMTRWVTTEQPAPSPMVGFQYLSQPVITAGIGVDTNGDGRPDYVYAGTDANQDGIPDALEGVTIVVSTSDDLDHGIPEVAEKGLDVNDNSQSDEVMKSVASMVDRISAQMSERFDRLERKMIDSQMHIASSTLTASGNTSLQQQVQSLEERVMSQESTMQETNALVNNVLQGLDVLLGKTDLSCVKGWLDDHATELHGKLDDQGKRNDDLAKLMDGMPGHDNLMDGVHNLLGKHMGDHSSKIMSEINNLPLPPDEKVLLQAIEGMQETVLAQTLEAIATVKSEIQGGTDSVNSKLDGHGKRVESLKALLDGTPDHATFIRGVREVLTEQMGEHRGNIVSEIRKMPLPPNEKLMLQAIENMEESVLSQTLEAIKKVKADTDSLHGKADQHGRRVDNITELMDGIPDQASIMRGVAEHMNDHSGQIMRHINKLPLPPNEKVMLQAIEKMEEAVLGRTLEEIGKLRNATELSVRGGIDRGPDHAVLMRGVHGLLAEHLSEHSTSIIREISNLPLPPQEKVLLRAIEDMEEASLGRTLEAMGSLRGEINNLLQSMESAWVRKSSIVYESAERTPQMRSYSPAPPLGLTPTKQAASLTLRASSMWPLDEYSDGFACKCG